jgi:hypothetical protein
MVAGMQEPDGNGHPKMLAYLKHFTAYSTETNRGHDDYAITAHDFFDTYLPQYEIAFKEGNASGVMVRAQWLLFLLLLLLLLLRRLPPPPPTHTHAASHRALQPLVLLARPHPHF